MNTKKLLALAALAFFAAGLATQNQPSALAQDAEAPLAPMAEHRKTTQNVVEALASRHYLPTLLNDDLSSRTFDAYLTDLDPSKSYLLAADVNEFEIYRYTLDDALRIGDVRPAFEMFNRYQKRVITRFGK
ncbi:MAG: hypothetical protein ACR2PJ_06035, partial [Pseudomonadales bacterium]